MGYIIIESYVLFFFSFFFFFFFFFFIYRSFSPVNGKGLKLSENSSCVFIFQSNQRMNLSETVLGQLKKVFKRNSTLILFLKNNVFFFLKKNNNIGHPFGKVS